MVFSEVLLPLVVWSLTQIPLSQFSLVSDHLVHPNSDGLSMRSYCHYWSLPYLSFSSLPYLLLEDAVQLHQLMENGLLFSIFLIYFFIVFVMIGSWNVHFVVFTVCYYCHCCWLSFSSCLWIICQILSLTIHGNCLVNLID